MAEQHERDFYEQMRLTLIGQVHELIDIAERHAWTKDVEEKRRTQGAIAHARKVTAPYNYNGSTPPSSPSIEREAAAPSIEVPPGMSRIDAFFWLEHRADVVEALAQKGMRVVSNADRVWLAPIEREVSGEGWVSMAERRPERGQLIVKRWKSNGAVWAGVYAATDKDSSFDEWVALPPCVTPCDGGKNGS